jgi:hypothetical protein
MTPGPWERDDTFKADMDDGIVIVGRGDGGPLFVCEVVNEADARAIMAVPEFVKIARDAGTIGKRDSDDILSDLCVVLAKIENQRTKTQKPAQSRGPVHKADVVQSLGNALMALGKGEPERVRWYIDQTRDNFEAWLEDRPEKKRMEKKRCEATTGQ